MKKLISLFLSLFFLSGCVAKYVEPSSSEPIASISFERSSKDPILGSSTFFISLCCLFISGYAYGKDQKNT